MGSQQSSPISTPTQLPTQPANEEIQKNGTTKTNNKPKKKKSPPPNLTGFALVQYNCRKKKRAYDICQAQHHKSFVSGTKLQDETGEEVSCDDLFEVYKECIYKGMYEDRKKRGLKDPTEESALGGYLEYVDED